MQESMAKQTNISMPARKLRRVINELRGKSALEAAKILKFMPYFAARVVEKTWLQQLLTLMKNLVQMLKTLKFQKFSLMKVRHTREVNRELKAESTEDSKELLI